MFSFLFYTFYNHTADNSKILRNRMDGTDPTVIYNNAKWIAGMTVGKSYLAYSVKPVLRGHLWDKEKMTL